MFYLFSLILSWYMYAPMSINKLDAMRKPAYIK